MSSSEELERHLKSHFDKLECSFVEEWSSAGGDLASLNATQSFEAVVRLLWKIRPSLKSRIPSFLLPPSATARFRMATLVAEAAKEVGVREKVGFQHLLYGTGKELSSLFIELLQLVPTEGAEEEEHDEEITFLSSLLRRARLLTADDVLWVPQFCRALKLKHDGRFWCPGESESELFPLSLGRPLDAVLDGRKGGGEGRDRRELAVALYREDAERREPQPAAISPSVPRVKPALLPKPSLKSPSSAPAPVEDESARLEREEVKRELREAEQALEKERQIREKILVKRARIAQERGAIEAELEGFDGKLMAILEDPEEARARIEKFMDDREERAAKLESKWEAARAEKMEELRGLREEVKRKSGPDSAQDRLRRGRAEKERLEMAREAYERRAEKLASRVALINADDAVNRHAYVRKLMEVTGNLKKQREELHKVWRETDLVLKDIKWSEQAAMRTFDLLEDGLYKTTNRSPKDERLYKNFVTMYNKCQLIVKEAENVGASKKRKEELIDQVDLSKNSSFLTQISPMIEDLTSIEEENRRLEELLQNS